MTVAPKRLLSVSRARSILPPFHFGPYYPRTSRTPRTVTAGIRLNHHHYSHGWASCICARRALEGAVWALLGRRGSHKGST